MSHVKYGVSSDEIEKTAAITDDDAVSGTAAQWQLRDHGSVAEVCPACQTVSLPGRHSCTAKAKS